jgi:3-oxoacyl-[acyl-carrier protein] reductase
VKPDRTILIAGSSHGIGRDLVRLYTDRGHLVFGLARSKSDFAHERYHHICADVTDAKAVQTAFTTIASRAPALHVMIYSAGVKTRSYAAMTRSKDAADMLRTDLLGAFLVTRHAVRLMKRAGFGRVVFISSVMVALGHPGTVIYGAGKAGLQQMAFALSHEFPQDDITFNALGLSLYPTPMTATIENQVLEKTRSGLLKKVDMTVEEVAGAIDYLASDAARQVTGQTIYFGGVR